MDSPQDVLVAPLPTGLMVTWKIDHKEWIELQNTECEIQSHEKDSDAKVSLSVKSWIFNCYVPCVTLAYTLILYASDLLYNEFINVPLT